ncbi:unnamed protein product, partial [Choristocarpus tenellus]
MFTKADNQHTGFLDPEQFRNLLEHLPESSSLKEDEMDRLLCLVDTEGNGRVSYRALVSFVVSHLGDWRKKLPEIASDLAHAVDQNLYGGRAAISNLQRRLEIADPRGVGRLTPTALGRCLRNVGLGLSMSQLDQMALAMDTRGDGLIPISPVLDHLNECVALANSRFGATEAAEGVSKMYPAKVMGEFCAAVWALADQERERMAKSYNKGNGRLMEYSGAALWHAPLRRVFDRFLDVDGDGFLTKADLETCLPDLGMRGSKEFARVVLQNMDARNRGLGQATFKDFVNFMLVRGGEHER